MARVRIEFTVEPFVEGHPGPHVLAAIEAVTERGVPVDVGPFSSVADVEVDQAASTVAALLQAALDRGATRLAVQLGGLGLPDGGLHGALARMIEQVEVELGGRAVRPVPRGQAARGPPPRRPWGLPAPPIGRRGGRRAGRQPHHRLQLPQRGPSVIELPVRAKRLVIDALTIEDATDVAAYRNDPEVARFQGWPLPYGVEEAAGLAAAGQLAIRTDVGVGRDGSAGRDGSDGQLVGDAMLDGVAGTEHAVEIGITLAPAAQGRGLATEAVIALVDAVFAAGRRKVVAYVDVRNERSLALFDRLGFRREGLLHHSFKGPDGLIDEVLFGLTADVWRHPTDGPATELDPHPADIARLGRGADGVQHRGHRRPRRHRGGRVRARRARPHRRGRGRGGVGRRRRAVAVVGARGPIAGAGVAGGCSRRSRTPPERGAHGGSS